MRKNFIKTQFVQELWWNSQNN